MLGLRWKRVKADRLVIVERVYDGEFDDVTLVGLIEQEWPERPRRNIFYPPSLLKALGWPSEKDIGPRTRST